MEIEETLNKLQGKVIDWIDHLILMLPNFIGALLVVIFFVFVAKIIRNLSEKVLSQISHNSAINKLISSVVYISIFLIGCFVALGILNLDKTVTSLLAGAGIIGLAIGFAFQDTFANFISGVIIATRRPFKIGDLIKTNEFFGTVHQMNLRSTLIYSLQGQIVIIPNKSVLQNPIINYSYMGQRRIDLEVGVSYGDDLDKVKEVTLNAVRKIDYLDKQKPIDLYYKEFGDSSINFVIRYWIKFEKQTEFLSAQSDGIMNIKKAYDDNDIMIPFPIRTLDFGIKGGEQLKEMWPAKENGKPNIN